MIDQAPRFDLADAERLARDAFGRPGRACELTSERDQNFEISQPEGTRFVVKIANALESPAVLEAQRHALEHLARHGAPTPRVILPIDDRDGTAELRANGTRHLAWAVTHLPGVTLSTLRHRPPALWEELGGVIAELATALATFDHPAVHREFHWDLAQGDRVLGKLRPHLDTDALGDAIDGLAVVFASQVEPLLPALRRAVIHNDLNDHNILVERETPSRPAHVSGILDFGDMVYGYAVGDLAIAAAYAMLDTPDPLAVLAALVRGYTAKRSLADEELTALFGLATRRLSMSACIAAEQRAARPDNAYLGVSQDAIRRTLPRLAAIPYGLATAIARDAAGRAPIAASPRVRDWLHANASTFASILDVDLRVEPSLVLDLGVASPLVRGDPRENAEPALTRRINDALAAAGVRVGIGRYDEARLLYTAPFFGRADAERRTIHIGLDLFAPAGTPVHAPLDGIVHAFADNNVPQDYGPVIILQHETGSGESFFTLYGHLSRASLSGLRVGQRIARGTRFASLGAPEENVGWTPHLHLQLITDLLDAGCDFPGVAPASQRAVWRSLSPDPNLLVGVPDERFPPSAPDLGATAASRRRQLGANLSVAYRTPLKIERGWMQYLYDETGRRYLDAYNNVPHVGHSHPRVVQAGQRQMAVLNTNTRYLSDLLNDYAARLIATFPAPLCDGVAFVVNSASEANELALRLARAYTGGTDTIVLEAAYHGNTNTLIDISPYKHAGPGGSGAPEWVHVAPLADTYRGAYKRSDPEAGRKYAGHVAALIDRLASTGRRLGAFIAETCPSVGGQIMFPPGYLTEVYRRVRAAGGICIADEVQTGLGRIGTHYWAFEEQDVVPDIVVMGKPLGNGHPIGAVVARSEVAAAFDNGMEFFSTFGGNTVSCAIGLAVLDVLEAESLQSHARAVGDRMLRRLHRFPEHYPIVGDVRGSGLFLGVELVRNRETLEPAGAEATYVVNRMREEGILVGTDGPYHNVVKIRPPMPFDEADADHLVAVVERIIADECVGWAR